MLLPGYQTERNFPPQPVSIPTEDMQPWVYIPAIALAAGALLAQGGKPLRVDGFIQERKLVYAPRPVYPRLAIQAHISGNVELAVRIGEDGSVERIRLIGGHPFLVGAAMDAVKQWEYQPTVRNGLPVVVLTTVTVRFRMGPSMEPAGKPGRKEAVIYASLARN